MTLIITALKQNGVVQVSDRRLTDLSTGKSIEDYANKAICVVCHNGSFSIAYTGLATIPVNGKVIRTDKWLAQHLTSINAGSMEVETILESIKNEATVILQKAKVPKEWKVLTFAIAGYIKGKAFMGQVSNFEGEPPTVFQDVQETFSVWIDTPSKASILIHGWIPAIDDTFWPRMEKIQKRIIPVDNETAIEQLVGLIRWAAKSKNNGGVIGMKCMAIAISGSDFGTHYFPFDGSPQKYSPHMIMSGISYMDIEYGGDIGKIEFFGIPPDTK